MKGKNTSRDTKKAPDQNGKKSISAYQAGKTFVSKIEIIPVVKKKKS